MDEDSKRYSEDEWESIQTRFRTEGLKWENLKENDKVLQLYRWLADSEANLKTSRLINEKLQKQHTAEKKDLNDYAEHLRQKCEKKVRDLEVETKSLRSELESLLSGTQAVTNVFSKEEIHDIANESLGQQIAYLLVERKQLQEELKVAKVEPSTDIENRLRIQLTKTCREFEIGKEKIERLEDEATEMRKRISHLEKTNKQTEEHNENLSFKLSEALYEMEEKERKQRKRSRDYSDPATAFNANARRGPSISEPNSITYHKDNFTIQGGDSSRPTGERRSDTEAVSLESCREESTTKLNSFLENQISNSKSHLSHLHEAKKLQSEVSRLKTKASLLADKYEEVVKIHHSFKINIMHNMDKEKKENENKIEELSKEVQRFRQEVTLKEEEIMSQKELQNEMNEELIKLRNYRLESIAKNNKSDETTKDCLLQIKLSNEKIKLMEEFKGKLLKNTDDEGTVELEAAG